MLARGVERGRALARGARARSRACGCTRGRGRRRGRRGAWRRPWGRGRRGCAARSRSEAALRARGRRARGIGGGTAHRRPGDHDDQEGDDEEGDEDGLADGAVGDDRRHGSTESMLVEDHGGRPRDRARQSRSPDRAANPMPSRPRGTSRMPRDRPSGTAGAASPRRAARAASPRHSDGRGPPSPHARSHRTTSGTDIGRSGAAQRPVHPGRKVPDRVLEAQPRSSPNRIGPGDGPRKGRSTPAWRDASRAGQPSLRVGARSRAETQRSRRRPIFPKGCPLSIFGAGELNFRVRDGNGCGLSARVTGIFCVWTFGSGSRAVV